jgi:hypothetical protein
MSQLDLRFYAETEKFLDVKNLMWFKSFFISGNFSLKLLPSPAAEAYSRSLISLEKSLCSF